MLNRGKIRAVTAAAAVFLAVFQASASPKQEANPHIRFGSPFAGGVVIFRGGYVSFHDSEKRQPLAVSYFLKKEYLEKKVKPEFAFMADPKLGAGKRAEVSDYAKTALVRARMAPFNAMRREREIMRESFYLSNVCPMDGGLYSGQWRELERKIEAFVLEGKPAWIVAGPVFKAKKQPKIGSGVWVPSHFYKAVLFQKADMSFGTAAYLFDNRSSKKRLNDCAVTLKELEEFTGLEFFNRLPSQAKSYAEDKKFLF